MRFIIIGIIAVIGANGHAWAQNCTTKAVGCAVTCQTPQCRQACLREQQSCNERDDFLREQTERQEDALRRAEQLAREEREARAAEIRRLESAAQRIQSAIPSQAPPPAKAHNEGAALFLSRALSGRNSGAGRPGNVDLSKHNLEFACSANLVQAENGFKHTFDVREVDLSEISSRTAGDEDLRSVNFSCRNPDCIVANGHADQVVAVEMGLEKDQSIDFGRLERAFQDLRNSCGGPVTKY